MIVTALVEAWRPRVGVGVRARQEPPEPHAGVHRLPGGQGLPTRHSQRIRRYT